MSTGRKAFAVMLFAVVVYAALTFLSDVRALRRALVAFHAWTFVAALALAFGNYLVRFAKWEFYLRKLDIGSHSPGERYRRLPTSESFMIFVSGFALSITPGKAGEVFRSALLRTARGTPIARSAPVVVADRLTDLLSLVMLVAVGSAAFPGWSWVAIIASAMVSVVLFFVVAPRATFRLFAVLRGLRVAAPWVPKLEEAYESLRVLTSPGALVSATLLSVVAWGLECAGLAIVLRGLDAPVGLGLAFFVYATATIAGAIAMLPGGLGGTEVTMQQMLVGLGHIGAAPAAAATLIVRLATLWFAVALGFVALAAFRRRFPQGAGQRAVQAPAVV